MNTAAPTCPHRRRIGFKTRPFAAFAALSLAAAMLAPLASANPITGGAPVSRNRTVVTKGAATPATKVAVADDPLADPPADALGTPANSTVARVDQMLIGRTDGATTSQRWVAPDADLGEVDEGPQSDQIGRTSLNQQYPTEPGRFLDPNADRAVAFRHVKMGGGDSLWQVGSSDDDALPGDGPRMRQITDGGAEFAGKTIALTSDGGRLSGPTDDGERGGHVATTDGSGDARRDQQWSMIESATAPGWYQLVSRADGLCMDALGGATEDSSPVGTYTCNPAVSDNQLWQPQHGVGASWLVRNKRSELVLDSRPDGTVVQISPGVEDSGEQFTIAEVVQPGGVLPTWSASAGDATPGAPFDLATGDLDRTVGSDDRYHDEVAFAYADNNKTLQVRVIDYNANTSHLMVLQPSSSLSFGLGTYDKGTWYPGSIGVAIGDFDGDSTNEVAVTWQNSAGVHVSFLNEKANGAKRSLDPTLKDAHLLVSDSAPGLSSVAGYGDVAVGDFDGTGRDQLAVAYVADVDNSVSTPVGKVLVTRFDGSLKPITSARHDLVISYSDNTPGKESKIMPPAPGPTWTQHGIRLAAGLFRTDNASDDAGRNFDLHRRQLAAAWTNDVRTDNYITCQHKDTGANERIYTWVRNTGVQIFAAQSTGTAPGKLNLSLQAAKLITSDPLIPPGDYPFCETPVAAQGWSSVPLSLAVGGLSGLGKPDDLPAWGIALGVSGRIPGDASAGSRVRLIVSHGTTMDVAAKVDQSSDTSSIFHLVGYDRAGQSLMLSPPLKFTVSNSQASAIAAQPPAHADWLPAGKDGAYEFLNVSRQPDFNVDMSNSKTDDYSTTTTTSTGKAQGVSEDSSLKVTAETGLPGLETEGSVGYGQKMNKQWNHDDSQLDGYTHKETSSIEGATGDDDYVVENTRTTTIYRYQILGGPLKKTDGTPYTQDSCTTACYGYYEVSVPGAEHQALAGGKDLDWYQPTWQNGNALSYPDARGGLVDIVDQGSYSYKDADNNTVTSNKPYFNTSLNVDTNSKKESMVISDGKDHQNSHNSSGSLFNEASLNLGLKTTVGALGFLGTAEAAINNSYNETDTWAHLTSGDNAHSTDKSVVENLPQIGAEQDHYSIASAYYTDKSGVDKVVHAVDFSNPTKDWSKYYGRQPDPALNLPHMSEMVKDTDGSGSIDIPKWQTADDRELIRGFYPQDATNNAPLGIKPVVKPGATVKFQVRVPNYSFVAAKNVPIRFYAVPVDTIAGTYGTPQPIGDEQTITGIAPRGAVTVASPTWTAANPDINDQQEYRIFVVLNQKGTIDEIHPLAGDPCSTDDTNEQQTLIDPMTGKADTHGCGQNNQGYGEISVAPTSGLEAGAHRTPKVQVEGMSLHQIRDTHRHHPRFQPAAGSVTVTEGDHLLGLVHAKTDIHSTDSKPVLVFDGPVANDHLIAGTHLAGVSAHSGGAAHYSWTATTPGRHVLHAVVMPVHKGDHRIEKTLVVNVKKAPVHLYRLADLPKLISSASMPDKVRDQLLTTVTKALQHQEAGQPRQARTDLDVLIRELRASSGSDISTSNATFLVNTTRRIQQRLTTPVDTLKATPKKVMATPRQHVRFAVVGYDRYGDRIGNLTSRSRFTINHGHCRGPVCWAKETGRHKITIRYGHLTTHARLTVHGGR